MTPNAKSTAINLAWLLAVSGLLIIGLEVLAGI